MKSFINDREIWKISTKLKKDEITIIMKDNEHPDAHVHARIKGKKGEKYMEDSFDIRTGESIHGIIKGDNARIIKRWIFANRAMLKQTWNRMYPKFPIRDAAHTGLSRIDKLILKLELKMLISRLDKLITLLEMRAALNKF